MALNSTSYDQDYYPNESKLNFDLYEGLADKVVNEVAIDLDQVLQQRSSTQHRDLANLGLQKGKK